MASIWDECPFTVVKNEQFTTHGSHTLSLVDLDTFKCWVDEVVDGWENDGHDVSEFKEKFNNACESLAKEKVYVDLDAESLQD